MKYKLLSIASLLLIICSSLLVTASVEDVKISLNEYYFSFIAEDMTEYLRYSYLEHLTEEQLSQKKDLITEIWKELDSGFAIDGPIKVTINEDLALAEYVLTARVISNQDEFKYEKFMIAILIYEDDMWKVFQAMPRSQFDFNMNVDMMFSDEQEELPNIEKYENFENECVPDLTILDELSNFSLPEIALSIIGDNKIVLLKISDYFYYMKINEGLVFLLEEKVDDFDYEVIIDSCAFERIIAGGNPKIEYDSRNIIINAKGFGDSFKLTIAKFLNSIYSLFKKEPYEIWVEAETGIMENKGPYSFIGSTSRGPGELYLGDPQTRVTYEIKSYISKEMHMYLRVSDDGIHRNEARSVDFMINEEVFPYNHISSNYITENNHWGWEYLGKVKLNKGINIIVITKPRQTSAAFTMDKFVLSENELDLK